LHIATIPALSFSHLLGLRAIHMVNYLILYGKFNKNRYGMFDALYRNQRVTGMQKTV